MLFKCIGILILFTFAFPSISQSQKNSQAIGEDNLLSALLSVETGDHSRALALLEDHKELITSRICERLLLAAGVSSGVDNSARPLFLYEIAKGAAKQLEDKKLLAFIYYKTGRYYFERDDIKRAVEEYLYSKKIFEETNSSRDLIYVLAELGTLEIYAADYVKAREYSEESLSLAASLEGSNEPPSRLPDKYGIAFARSNLGNVAKWEGDYNTALENLRKSLVLWKELRSQGFWAAGNIVDALADLSHVYQAMGDHLQAFNYLSQAMDVAKTLLNKGRVGALLNDMGVLYIEQGDYTKASELLNKSLQIFLETNNRREVARNLLNIGVINYRQGRHDAALIGFRESLSRAEEIDALEIIIAAQEGLGSTYQALGNYQLAMEWFEKAWSLAQKIGDKIRMTELLWRKGQVSYSHRDYIRSSELASAAADLATQLRLPLMSYLALTLRGKAYQAQKADRLASESFIRAIDAVEHMRAQVAGGEREQQLFFEDKLSPYHEMVSLLVKQNNYEEALKYAERAKARVLLDVLRHGRINISKTLSKTEQSEERRLYGEMVSLNTQVRVERMRQQSDDRRIAELEARLQKARNTYETLQAALYTTHPELKAKRGHFPAFDLEAAAALMPDSQTALLEYVVTQEQTFLFVLTKGPARESNVGVEVFPINITKNELVNLVESFRKLLAVNHPGFRQPGQRLYDLLIRPAEQLLERKNSLCIVPDSILWELPFQALQTAQGKYLLELHATYYAPSLQVLGEMKKRAASLRSAPFGKQSDRSSSDGQVTRQLYAIGNPTVNGEVLARIQAVRNMPFVSLPETEKEVQAIGAEVYDPKASSVRVGSAAREDLVKAEADKYRVVHFATHGVLNDHSPLYSYLLLSPGENSGEDGLLEAWELMEMDLKAEIVVLSACETARGYVGNGEGMIGMTWALFVAGVPTTVASQWKVPSETTARLMVAFHRNAKQVSKAEAWRKAALEMINDPRYRMKPFYWAGFVVMGEGGR
jgi:CHAT domain-containing protein/Tfp pilus assembly protein PilF